MPLDIFEEYATDAVKEVEGAEVPLGADTVLVIARGGNKNFNREILAENEANEVKFKMLPPEQVEALDTEIICRVMAKTILLGWKNLNYKGTALKYSQKNAEMLLRHNDFRAKVLQLANNIAFFKSKIEEAAVKN